MCHRFRWQLPVDHAALAGHFPGQPVAPGAVLLDRLALCAGQVPGLVAGPLRLDQVKFLQLCRPLDELDFVLEPRADGRFAFRIERGGVDIVRGTVSPAGEAAD